MGVPGVGGAGVRGAAAPVGVFRVLPGRVTSGSFTALSRVALIFRPNVLGRSQLSPWVQNGQIEWRAGSDKKSCSLQIELAKSIMDILSKNYA